VTAYPSQLRVGSGSEKVVLVLRPDLHSVRHAAGRAPKAAIAWLDEGAGAYGVFAGGPAARAAGDEGPVYSTGEDGPLAVPTGRVFVRLSEGLRAEDHRSQFGAAGFEIEQVPSYAPDAAWLRPREGGVAAALNGLHELERLAGVVHVEPQLLRERAARRS
jgi:hypothetical protein